MLQCIKPLTDASRTKYSARRVRFVRASAFLPAGPAAVCIAAAHRGL
jgi:hypothetical protein